MDQEALKKMAAESVLSLVKDGMVIGMGSGSTVMYAIDLVGEKIKSDEMELMAVPTSYHTVHLCIAAGIPLTTLDEYPSLDLVIDGADEVDPHLNLIKGGGAALTREKIVGSAAKFLVIIVDESKLVKNLGEKARIPLEVLPFSLPVVIRQLETFGSPHPRMSNKKLGPVVTDNGNFIVDLGVSNITDYSVLESQLNNIPGVLENGLFINMADIVHIGSEKGVQVLTKV